MPESRKSGPRKPGRPKLTEDLRDPILKQAEIAFAAEGYDGASLREIAAQAGVNQALVRYYFGSKQELFDEVFRRRGKKLAQRRISLLEELLANESPPSVEAILRAYLHPQWEMKQAGPSGTAFLRLQARLHASPEDHALRLRREIYDAPLRLYLDALSLVLPETPRKIIATRMAFVIGSYLFMLNDLARLDDLVGEEPIRENHNPVVDALVTFLAAGMKAPPR